MTGLRDRSGSVLIAALWAVTLWLVGYYTLLLLIGFVFLLACGVLWLVATARLLGVAAATISFARQGRGVSALPLAVPLAMSATALAFVAWQFVQFVPEIA